MAVHYRTQAFIIKKADRGENDQVLTIYSREFGKLDISGKAIRKISSKLRPGSDLFRLSEVEFIQGKNQKTLTDVAPIEKFKNIISDLVRMQISFQVTQLLDDLVKGQEKDEKIWELLGETFQKLNGQSLPPSVQQIIYYYFFWNLLSQLGYQTDLYHCGLCQKKLSPQKIVFDPETGMIDSECVAKSNSASRIGLEVLPDIVKILRLIAKKEWNILSRLKINDFQMSFLKNLTDNYLSYIRPAAL